MKKYIFLKILVIFLVLSSVCFYSLATDNPLDLYDTNGIPSGAENGMEKTQKIINRSLTIVQLIGFFTAVAMLVVMGMKFMLGSIEDKVQVKQHLTVYVIGAVVLFGATGILEVIKNVIDGTLD